MKKSFSERMGFKRARDSLQIEGVDSTLRTALWNKLYSTVADDYAIPYIWTDFLNYPKNQLYDSFGNLGSLRTQEVIDKIYAKYTKLKWYEIYDFLEYLANYTKMIDDEYLEDFTRECNDVLENYLSGYRLIGTQIVPLTSEHELEEIDTALGEPPDPVAQHIETALFLMADREAPDYRNSIKESISAVEAMCRLITDNESTTLGKCIKKLDEKLGGHPALHQAFDKLYGWTNDESGVRHSLMDESELGLEDATFMLVTCSAYVNYLKEKARKAGIEF